MQRGRLVLQFVLLFVCVLVGYFLVFNWIERRRVNKGPWEVTFATENGRPQLTINQPALDIRDVRILFAEVPAPSNTVERVIFSKAQNPPYPVPFGECIFQDLLFQPGTVTLRLFGHEIQMIPRTLTIDRVEQPWKNGETITVKTPKPNAPVATP
jgi:hypothetical protein